MKTCQNCGMQMPDSANFCRKCGSMLPAGPDPVSEPEPMDGPETEMPAAAEESAAMEPAAIESAAPEEPAALEEAAPAEPETPAAEEPETPAAAAEPAAAEMKTAPVREPKPADHTKEFAAEDISENKLFAMAAYLLGPLGIIIAALAGHGSGYTGFHVKQALKLTIIEVLFGIIVLILHCLLLLPLPVPGSVRLALLAVIGLIALLFVILHIACFVQVCRNKAAEVPVIRSFRFLK